MRDRAHALTEPQSVLLPCRAVRLSFSHHIGRALCVALWLTGMAAQSQAQTTAEAAAPADAPPDLPTAPSPAAAPRALLFLLAPDLHPAVAAGLSDALEAQLSGTGTAVHWDALNAPSTDLRAAIEQGKPAATLLQAAGVFWLDASDQSNWLLYLMDAGGERILVRRIENAAGSPTASIEAIAVIVRESALALIAGQPIAMDPVTPVAPAPTPAPIAPTPTTTAAVPAPAATTAQPTATAPTPRLLRAAIGYPGSPLSTDVPWQHGLALQASLFASFGGFLGVGYTLIPTLDIAQAGVSMTLDRRPLRLLAGYAHSLTRHLRIDLEIAGILDIATRTTRAVPTATDASDDETGTIFGTGLSVRLNVIPQPNVELFVSLGGEGFFNRFEYVVAADDPITMLSPWSLTPVVEAGVAFRP